ncbi:hypothetical protein ACFQ8C_28065 [Streptomyces sp. NPDC056503]|uniref:hypothetical protein n=1 Tax=Streptomyces sp. NPDC056503 TaxID=3345842 RepID=UPI0036A157B1
MTFHVHEKVEGSREFRHEQQFAAVMEDLAHDAGKRVEEFRDRFADLDAVARALLSHPVRRDDLRGSFHAGVAAALTGRAGEARERFSAVLAHEPDADWMRELRQTARQLFDAGENAAAVRVWARDAVVSCRSKPALGDAPASVGEMPA